MTFFVRMIFQWRYSRRKQVGLWDTFLCGPNYAITAVPSYQLLSVWGLLILYYSEIFSSILHFLSINQVGGNETFFTFENYKGIYKGDSLHILKANRSNCNLCNTIEGKGLDQIRTWWRVRRRFGKELATIYWFLENYI